MSRGRGRGHLGGGRVRLELAEVGLVPARDRDHRVVDRAVDHREVQPGDGGWPARPPRLPPRVFWFQSRTTWAESSASWAATGMATGVATSSAAAATRALISSGSAWYVPPITVSCEMDPSTSTVSTGRWRHSRGQRVCPLGVTSCLSLGHPTEARTAPRETGPAVDGLVITESAHDTYSSEMRYRPPPSPS